MGEGEGRWREQYEKEEFRQVSVKVSSQFDGVLISKTQQTSTRFRRIYVSCVYSFTLTPPPHPSGPPQLGFACLFDDRCSLCALCTPFSLLFSATPTQKLPSSMVTAGGHSNVIQQSLTEHVFGSVNGAEVPYVRLHDTQVGVLVSRLLYRVPFRFPICFDTFCVACSLSSSSRFSSPPRTPQQRRGAIVNIFPRANERVRSDFDSSLSLSAEARGLGLTKGCGH